MAKQNGRVPGTYVSEKDLHDLSELLGTFKDYILSHEARLELLEAWVANFMEANTIPAESETETDGTEEAEGSEDAKQVLYSATDDETWDAIEAHESSDDPTEG